MYNDDIFHYSMTVTGTPEEQQAVYNALCQQKINDTYLTPCGTDSGLYSNYRIPEESSNLPNNAWPEEQMENTLHHIALQVPQAVLEITGQDQDDRSYGFTKRFHGDLFQETRSVTYLPPLTENGDIPFSERGTYQVPPRKVYVLCEEYEGNDGIREFMILAVSEDKEQLRRLMRAKIEKDEYGYVADNGIHDDTPDHFQTEFDGGFVEYYIAGENVLTRSQIEQQLQTPAYDTTFYHPDNLRDLLCSTIADMAEDHGFGLNLNIEQAADVLLADKQFQSACKQQFWMTVPHIPEKAFTERTVHSRFCFDFIHHLWKQNPEYFIAEGAAQKFQYPDNLKEILSGSIYDAAKDLRLPVTDVELMTDQYFRNPKFQAQFSSFSDIPHLEEGSDAYKKAIRGCYDFAREKASADLEAQGKKIPLDARLRAAQTKSGQRQITSPPDKER